VEALTQASFLFEHFSQLPGVLYRISTAIKFLLKQIETLDPVRKNLDGKIEKLDSEMIKAGPAKPWGTSLPLQALRLGYGTGSWARSG